MDENSSFGHWPRMRWHSCERSIVFYWTWTYPGVRKPLVISGKALDLEPPPMLMTPTLFRFTMGGADGDQIITLSPQPFTRDMVAQYAKVASGELAPADLHAPAEPPVPPITDLTTVRQRFRRESRAVQAMSIWQAEGSGTPRFFSEVNRMIQEDAGVDILLTGMFNMTAVLSAMTATVLGVPPGGTTGWPTRCVCAPTRGREDRHS